MERLPLHIVARLCLELATEDDLSSWNLIVSWPRLWRATSTPPSRYATFLANENFNVDTLFWRPMFISTGGDVAWFPPIVAAAEEPCRLVWRERFLEHMRGPLRKARTVARCLLSQHAPFMIPLPPPAPAPASASASASSSPTTTSTTTSSASCGSTTAANTTIVSSESASSAAVCGESANTGEPVIEPPAPPAPLAADQLALLAEGAIFLLRKQPNVVNVPLPVVIVGDIHGQLEDLHHVLSLVAPPPRNSFLFLGDYVDRGRWSVQCITLILALKLLYPSFVTLLRGNHECRQLTQIYGLFDECKAIYKDDSPWSRLCDVFDALPLAAIAGNRVFAVHGGPSPDLHEMDDICKLDRFCEFPHAGLMTDLVWSDPDPSIEDWTFSPRGAGSIFGGHACGQFLTASNLHCIIRSHRLVMEGIIWEMDNRVCTVYSCSNYCYRCGNRGCLIILQEWNSPRDTSLKPNEKLLADGTILVREITWTARPEYPHQEEPDRH
ncbi:serine/threonine-protein phosphatase 2A, catalytic subunit [Pelomyxa schiedti]|nr:serine/threonine-protein phosphatase 2A, catalytic subunit [Pelomyxa schiedti]